MWAQVKWYEMIIIDWFIWPAVIVCFFFQIHDTESESLYIMHIKSCQSGFWSDFHYNKNGEIEAGLPFSLHALPVFMWFSCYQIMYVNVKANQPLSTIELELVLGAASWAPTVPNIH